jgi:hypothetical protein
MRAAILDCEQRSPAAKHEPATFNTQSVSIAKRDRGVRVSGRRSDSRDLTCVVGIHVATFAMASKTKIPMKTPIRISYLSVLFAGVASTTGRKLARETAA